jgi:two-component system, LuxR family, response regulator FixJ
MSANEITNSTVVCVVDDDEAVLASTERLLTSDGFTVRAFDKPNAFLAHAKTHPVPVVVLDVWMEQMTGLEVQAQLAKVSPGTRVIILTGRKDPGVEQTALDFGAVAFLLKPFDDEDFLVAVRSALSRREARSMSP